MSYKKLRKSFPLICFAILLAGHGFSQSPDLFAGKWVLDRSASASVNSENDSYNYFYLTLAFEADKLTITEDYARNNGKIQSSIILFTDKRGEKNTLTNILFDKGEVKSKTHWKNNEIIREYSFQQDTGLPRSYQINNTTEKLSLSKDSKNLYYSSSTIGDFYLNGSPAKSMGRGANSGWRLVFRRA